VLEGARAWVLTAKYQQNPALELFQIVSEAPGKIGNSVGSIGAIYCGTGVRHGKIRVIEIVSLIGSS